MVRDKDAVKQRLETLFGKPDAPAGKSSPENMARLKVILERILAALTYREREVIKYRYGLGDGHIYTLKEVGKIFRVTPQRVHQIEAKAVRKLEHPIREMLGEMLESSPDAPSSSLKEKTRENQAPA